MQAGFTSLQNKVWKTGWMVLPSKPASLAPIFHAEKRRHPGEGSAQGQQDAVSHRCVQDPAQATAVPQRGGGMREWCRFRVVQPSEEWQFGYVLWRVPLSGPSTA